jgi:hypothetical protein
MFRTLEADALALQQQTLSNPEMTRLQTFLLDALADPNNQQVYNRAAKGKRSYALISSNHFFFQLPALMTLQR